MLGMIMGKSGEELGNTLWGQTELSCYDDSMHGIWGMSYKYHERAIVFNEKNLIRMWDIAYDGYCGGKDSTNVDWNNEEEVQKFKEATVDISKVYTGPSMMVMAFHHEHGYQASPDYKRNWPSPIVFHDPYNFQEAPGTAQNLATDAENIYKINPNEFRVFNNPLYHRYEDYYKLMPEFTTMHNNRKNAGHSASENETSCDSLAFQGSMRIFENGTKMDEILGSGHHGPDYVGAASLRAGKGMKMTGQMPTLSRLV